MIRILYFLILTSSFVILANGHENATVNPPQRLKWISDFLPDALKKFTIQTDNNPECKRHEELYIQHLSNNSFWAVKMMDSSVTSQNGILTSSSYNFGAYDQCLNIQVPHFKLYGQYCIASLSVKPKKSIYPKFYDAENDEIYREPGPFESAWIKLKKSKDQRILNRDTIYWAICIPSSCTSNDLELSLKKVIYPILINNSIDGNLTVESDSCQTLSQRPSLDEYGIIFLCFIISLVSIVVIVTLVHMLAYSEEERNKLKHWMFKFSLVTNLKRLVKPDSPKEFQFLSGMKVWSMIIIIYGHRLLSNLYRNILNPGDQEQRYGEFFETINFNGAIIVNTFLLISGFLSYHKYLMEVEEKRKLNVGLFILYRWMRVTPVYMVVIGFLALVFPITDGGPFWKSEGLLRFNNCRKNWWTYLLYINNYYKTEEECLIPSWYLAVDMQMFVICAVIGYITYKSMKIIPTILSILTCLSIIIPAYVFYQGEYNGVIKFYLNYLPTYFQEEDYLNTYTRTHMRASPYFIGMATAFLCAYLEKSKFKFNKWQMALGIFVALLFTVGTLLSAWIFFIPGYNVSPIIHIMYGSLNRVLWAIALAWLIVAESTTGFGILSSILKQKVYGPLNKLTLSVLIIHTPLQELLLLKQRLPNHLEATTTIWMTCGDVLMSYSLALILYLIVEAPMASLQMMLLKKLIKIKK